MKTKIIAAILLILITVGMVYAQPTNNRGTYEKIENRIQYQKDQPRIQTIREEVEPKKQENKKQRPKQRTEPVLLGHGFALDTSNGLEYHTIHINIMKTLRVEKIDVRDMLDEGLSAQEIVDRLLGRERVEEVRGHLKFAGVPYGLRSETHV